MTLNPKAYHEKGAARHALSRALYIGAHVTTPVYMRRALAQMESQSAARHLESDRPDVSLHMQFANRSSITVIIFGEHMPEQVSLAPGHRR
jgi:hypothetical protein